MEKEDFEKRLNFIDSEINKIDLMMKQGLADLNALRGSRQECLYWLQKCAEKDAKGISLDDLKKMLGADKLEIIDLGDVNNGQQLPPKIKADEAKPSGGEQSSTNPDVKP